jgi:hypothetical protein
MSITELPFGERPVIELLALDRDADPEFDGYGWAKVDRLWLAGEHGWPRRVDDALVIAVHAADDGASLADDIELDFAVDRTGLRPAPPAEPSAAPPPHPPRLASLVDGGLVRVRASAFLRDWIPRLPDAGTIVLAMCNPHRAALARPPGTAATIHYAAGDVRAWLDPGRGPHGVDRVRLTADAWRTLGGVTTDLTERPGAVISDEDKQTYIGLYLLKKLDLKPEDGGIAFPVVLPSELSPLDEPLQQLAVDGHLVINQRKNRWELTKKGLAYLAEHIDEATQLVDEFDDDELPDVLAELRARNLDVFRARFLWGWYEGELDDLVLYQERRGVKPVERLWAFYLTGDELWRDLARELET